MRPWLKAVGAVLLLYIGTSLLAPEKSSGTRPKARGSVWGAIRTIVVADLIMSLDNEVAVAAAAHDNTVLLLTGLVLSIPLVVFGSTLLLKVIRTEERRVGKECVSRGRYRGSPDDKKKK